MDELCIYYRCPTNLVTYNQIPLHFVPNFHVYVRFVDFAPLLFPFFAFQNYSNFWGPWPWRPSPSSRLPAARFQLRWVGSAVFPSDVRILVRAHLKIIANPGRWLLETCGDGVRRRLLGCPPTDSNSGESEAMCLHPHLRILLRAHLRVSFPVVSYLFPLCIIQRSPT